MQIIIRVNNYEDFDESFVYNYIPQYIYDRFLKIVDIGRLAEFDKFFEINSFDILVKVLRNLLITKNGNYEYIIKINKLIKSDNVPAIIWISAINYGTREIKGYPILIDLFKHIQENIGLIYKEWEDGS